MGSSGTFDEFKAHHAHHSAEIIRGIMLEVQFEENVIDNVYHLICQHEIGGDPRSDLIKDADSISFFDVNLPLYFQRNSWEESKRRCNQKPQCVQSKPCLDCSIHQSLA